MRKSTAQFALLPNPNSHYQISISVWWVCALDLQQLEANILNHLRFAHTHHADLDQSTASTPIPRTPNSSTSQPHTPTSTPTPHTPNPTLGKAKIGSLSDSNDDSLLVGCRKVKGVTKFYDQTAGTLALVHPCGVIVNAVEMFTWVTHPSVTFSHHDFRSWSRYSKIVVSWLWSRLWPSPLPCNLEKKGAFFAKWLNDKVTLWTTFMSLSTQTVA